ncbi:MAG: methyltransferase [Terracidiphilus sp.]
MPTNPFQYIFPGIVAAQAIHAAVEFNIPDLLASGPKSSTELAAECGAYAPTLERLLRALTSIDMFQRLPDGRYRNTSLTDVLRADHPQSLKSEALFLPAPFMWRPLGELAESIRTGEAAFDRVYGQNLFEYLAGKPEESDAFNRVMAQEISWTTPALLRAYDFSRVKRLVDVGGGHGLFLSQILAASPKLEGVLFDQPQVVAVAEKHLKGEVAARIKIVKGSFFNSVPEGADAYLLKRILHDWNDQDAARILGNVRRAIPANGKLLLLESLVDSPVNPAGLTDLVMLVIGGRERTEADFRSLLESSGFSLRRIVPVGPHSLLECQPA